MIFLTGATGFVGSHLTRHLSEAGVPVRALVRGESTLIEYSSVEPVRGDVLKRDTLTAAMRGCDTVIHLVGIIKETKNMSFQQAHIEATRNAIEAAKQNSITRFIQMSALGTRVNAVSKYHQTKWQAEELVRASGLNWTIFRPSMIYGERSEFIASMLQLMRAPITPIISPGMNTGLLQPIHVDDLCACFVQAARDATQKTFAQTYECGGPDRLTTKEVLNILARLSGRRLSSIPVPFALANVAMGIGEKLGLPVPATPQQLLMLRENNICDISGMKNAFGIEPRGFQTGVRELLSAQ